MSRENEQHDASADDALLWGGETGDPTYLDGPAREEKPLSRRRDVDTVIQPAATGTNPVLIYAYGLFGGVYGLYAIGWVLAIPRDSFAAPDILSAIMYQLGQFLAILAPVIWIALTFLLTRHSRTIIRLLWLVIGVLLLAPWPFILPAQGGTG